MSDHSFKLSGGLNPSSRQRSNSLVPGYGVYLLSLHIKERGFSFFNLRDQVLSFFISDGLSVGKPVIKVNSEIIPAFFSHRLALMIISTVVFLLINFNARSEPDSTPR